MAAPAGAVGVGRGARAPARFGGFAFGWEVGLLVVMAPLYLVGTSINPRFFGDLTALQSVLRDASRYGVMAVGMTFVIVNRDLDLSVGSTLGLVAVVFSIAFAPTHFDLPAWAAILVCLAVGLAIGLINGVLVTWLKVPAFIATLTMLFVGRGLVLGLTGGKTIAYEVKAREFAFFALGETQRASASTTRSWSSCWSPSWAASCSPARAGATRPTPSAATRWRPSMPASTRGSVRIRGFVLASLVRHARRADERRPGQGRHLAIRPGCGAHRHRRGDRRRRLDPGRARPGAGLLPGCRPGRADRQGAARGRADHPHAQDRRPGDAGPGDGLPAAGCRARPSSA